MLLYLSIQLSLIPVTRKSIVSKCWLNALLFTFFYIYGCSSIHHIFSYSLSVSLFFLYLFNDCIVDTFLLPDFEWLFPYFFLSSGRLFFVAQIVDFSQRWLSFVVSDYYYKRLTCGSSICLYFFPSSLVSYVSLNVVWTKLPSSYLCTVLFVLVLFIIFALIIHTKSREGVYLLLVSVKLVDLYLLTNYNIFLSICLLNNYSQLSFQCLLPFVSFIFSAC